MGVVEVRVIVVVVVVGAMVVVVVSASAATTILQGEKGWSIIYGGLSLHEIFILLQQGEGGSFLYGLGSFLYVE